jgi:ABC-2 type transport system ATP-binding protein
MTNPTLAVKTIGLGKRFGQVWALEDCSIEVPRGSVSALVGPNGAGKTTLLRLLVGLRSPTVGQAFVFDNPPHQDNEFLASVGYLAQQAPLYLQLTAAEHLELGGHLNSRWDADAAARRLNALHVPIDRAVKTLSVGQRSQVALALALAKRPQLLLLDEPVAALDPLARRDFLATLAEAVADGDLTVMLSSHLLHDLERVCDHIILLAAAKTQLSDDIDHVLATHKVLVGPRKTTDTIEGKHKVIHAVHSERQTRLLVQLDGPLLNPTWEATDVSLEDIVLAYMGDIGSNTAGPLSLVGGGS